jgi:hypothetical protein
MSKILISTSIFLLSFITTDSIWRTYTSYDGGFKIETPGDMKEVINTGTTALGDLKYHVFVYRDNEDDADNLMYMISYCDYPEGSIHSDSTEFVNEFLDATVESSVQSVNGSLVYSHDVKMKKYPGKLWRVDYGEGQGVIRTKAFIKGNRFYTIQTACNSNKSLNMSSDKFMDSFSFLNEAEKVDQSKKDGLRINDEK